MFRDDIYTVNTILSMRLPFKGVPAKGPVVVRQFKHISADPGLLLEGVGVLPVDLPVVGVEVGAVGPQLVQVLGDRGHFPAFQVRFDDFFEDGLPIHLAIDEVVVHR